MIVVFHLQQLAHAFLEMMATRPVWEILCFQLVFFIWFTSFVWLGVGLFQIWNHRKK
jgi:hypothetical protein